MNNIQTIFLSDHSKLEFGYCLEFGAWNLGLIDHSFSPGAYSTASILVVFSWWH